jgi:pimeloyl-ACP methyl ester carboxylesterase
MVQQQFHVTDQQGDSLWGAFCNPQEATDTSQTLVLIIAGSGPTDRNGNNSAMKNNSLKMLAHDLSKFGIASIRYDKRGVAGSMRAIKSEEEMVFQDNVADASLFYDYALSLGYHKIVVAGHSEGSLVGILLSQEQDASGFISLAGAGRPIQDVLKEQYEATAPIIRDSAHTVIDLLASGKQCDTLSPWLFSVFRPSIQPYIISWMQLDPAKELSQLTCPSIVIQGDNDIQVSVKDAQTLAQELAEDRLVILKGMNHVFKKVGTDRSENKASYNDPSLPLHQDLVFTIVSFIKELP